MVQNRPTPGDFRYYPQKTLRDVTNALERACLKMERALKLDHRIDPEK